MPNPAEQVLKTIEGIKALRKLLKDVDPASGMSVAVRRGVARDDDTREDDASRRPWTTIEMGGAGDNCAALHLILTTMIAHQVELLAFWRSACIANVREHEKAVVAANAFMRVSNKGVSPKENI